LFYVFFSGLSWNLVQNTWIRPENTSRAIWSFPEFEADPEKIKNRPRHFDRSIICTANNSIDRSTFSWLNFDRSRCDWSILKAQNFRSIYFASSKRSRYFQIFVRSKSKVGFNGQKWTATSSVCVARIDPWWVPCKLNLYIYEIMVLG